VDVFGLKEAQGTVVGQVPAPGTEWMTGRPVAIAVSAGPDDGTAVEVPDVLGDSVDTALSTLEQSGLVGAGAVVDPTSLESSAVTRQLPEGGAMVRPGTTVLLLFDLP